MKTRSQFNILPRVYKYICFFFKSTCDNVNVTKIRHFLWRCSIYAIFINVCHYAECSSALKPGLIHHFLHLKMPLPSQKYDCCFPFV